jgi:hypothetical protein
MLHRTDASRQTVDMGSKADIAASPTDVRFTPKSGRGSAQLRVKR